VRSRTYFAGRPAHICRQDALARRQQRACRQHPVALDLAPVHHDRAEPDETAIVERAAMQHRDVPDQAIRTDHGRPALRGDMDDGAVLDIGPWPHRDRSMSPRSTQLYQMLASSPIVTSPIRRAPGATNALSATAGIWPPKGSSVTPSISALRHQPRRERRMIGQHAGASGALERGQRLQHQRSALPDPAATAASIIAYSPDT
jgi:hypothetical protein